MRIVFGVLLATLVALPAAAQIQEFSILIDNVQEQAAGNCLLGSSAEGSGTAQLDLGTSNLSWSMTFGTNSPAFDNGLLSSGNELFAHFHNAPPGVNGPVEITLSNGSPKVGNQVLSPAQVTAIQAGNFYVNIHSLGTDGGGCTAGEIRGQVVPGALIPTLTEWGMILLALLGLTAGTIALTRRGAAVASTA